MVVNLFGSVLGAAVVCGVAVAAAWIFHVDLFIILW